MGSALWCKLLPEIPAFHINTDLSPLMIQLSPNALGKAAEDNPSAWTPYTHVGESEELLTSSSSSLGH